MPEFTYKAVTVDGRTVRGALSSVSRSAAVAQLRRQGVTPLTIEVLAEGAPAPAGAARARRGLRDLATRNRQRVTPVQVLSLTRELSTLLRAGLPLDRALQVLLRMTRDVALSRLISDVLDAVKGGKGLSQALQGHQAVFGDFYINMVRAGEASGQLASILGRLAEHLESTRQLRQNIVSALIYPAILVGVAFISVVIMLAFVVPQFEALFEDMGDGLPMATRIVVAMGDIVAQGWWILMLMLLAALVLIDRLPRNPQGRLWLDRRWLGLPWIGDVLHTLEIARFTRTMGTLLGSGVSMLESLRIAVDTVGNQHLRAGLERMPADIKQGGAMTAAMDKTRLFSPLAIQMVQVGEEAGRLDEMLLELARITDEDVRGRVKRVISVLEPMLILVLGVVIAGIILAILMGIMSVTELVA